ncbi:MAG: caspase family protein [Spirochaetes bacterium]|nr:caspase family protein [Spirochaetota bacterium]
MNKTAPHPLPLLALLLGLSVRCLHPAELSREPVLRLEAGMHTARINQVAGDARGRFLATASHDKTARIWDAASGRLLRVLRPPIAAGGEGRLHAVAMTPEGRWVLAAGYTGYETSGRVQIDRFDRETGDLVEAFGELPDVVQHLALSADGRFLAASLLGKNGVRVFTRRGDGYVALPPDADGRFAAPSYGAAFYQIPGAGTSTTLLAATGFDGSIRLFKVGDDGLILLETLAPRGGRAPFGVAFAADGSRMAVGFNDQNKLDLWKFAGAPTPLPIAEPMLRAGNLSVVAFGGDGSLWASGWPRERGNLLRRFAPPAYGAAVDTALCEDTVTSLLALPGGLAFASCDPALGRVDSAGKILWSRKPPMAINDENHDRFALSTDGSVVAFAFESRGPLVAFSLARRAYLPEVPPELRPARLQGLPLASWRNSPSPTLSGKAIPLDVGEHSTCAAATGDLSAFILGTSFKLRAYGADGALRWQRSAPALAWCVDVSPDGRTAVAAFADGTIRWFRMDSGTEVLALFPHADRSRWILWTPKGYYDAAAGAEDLLGWHVNRGPRDAADFFPIGRFRDGRFRPDWIDAVVKTWEGDAQPKAVGDRPVAAPIEGRLPPVLTILSPTDSDAFSTTSQKLRVRVRSPGGEPITGVKILVDGRPLSGSRGLSIRAKPEAPDERSLDLELPERDVVVSAFGENAHGAGAAASVRLRWAGSSNAPPKPRLFVLAIGVSEYREPSLRLKYAAKDARDFTAIIRAQKGKLYREVNERLLTDAEGTRAACEAGLEWIRGQTKADDTAMVFLAGHGVSDPTGKFWFLPVDADPERLEKTCLGFAVIRKAVSSIAGRALFFIDSCQSGNVLGDRSGTDGLVNELASAENGAIVFTSATGRQFAFEDSAWANGAFTKALVEALGGAPGWDDTGAITVFGVNWYLSKRVKELPGRKQTPATAIPATVPDFPVVGK